MATDSQRFSSDGDDSVTHTTYFPFKFPIDDVDDGYDESNYDGRCLPSLGLICLSLAPMRVVTPSQYHLHLNIFDPT